jgi:membrane protein
VCCRAMLTSGARAAAPAPARPTPLRQLSRDQWKALASAVYSRFGEIQITDRAATLTYYGFLSLFPGLIVAAALLSLFGSYPDTYESIIDTLREAAPGPAIDTIDSALRDVLRQSSGSAGGLLGIGLIVALVSASGGIGAAIRSLDVINGREGRGIVGSRLAQLWLTLALMALLLLAFSALLVAGPLFSSIAEAAGLEASSRSLVSALRYPVGIAALVAALLLLYWQGPAGPKRPPLEHLPGALLAAALGALASMGFSLYVSNFSSYDATYGALGAIIVLLVWLYVGNLALLIGALTNRELRRVRERN